ncbi:MAG: carbohydrate ABC transporter permease, partial [Geminicoccaceae bacterium]|nr:carbohydrate ABC transporter permease [Geminicoccaceae bacterium]
EVLSGERGDVLRPLLNSTLIGLTATALATLLGSMAAYALVRFEMRVRLVAALVFVAAGIGGYLGLDHAGWSDGGAMGGALLVALATSVPANRIPFPGKVFANADIAFWFISQRMFPPIVSAFALYLLYARLGRDGFQLLDTFWGMTLCYTAFVLPVVVWLMRDFFRSLPVAVEEAALVDDVPRWRIFLEIVLPMSRGGLVATFLISLGFVWNEFLFALILTSSKWQTMPIMISGQNSVRGTEWWSISAAALVAILPMMIATWFIARMMRSGIALGGLK